MSDRPLFEDRADAGRRLAAAIEGSAEPDPMILALPRGGVVVGFEVAVALGAPLDVVVARKVGAPGHREFGIGAVAEAGVRIADLATLRALAISEVEFGRLADADVEELERRVAMYRGERRLQLKGRNAMLVDDGVATGVTAEAALLAVRRLGADRVVLAVPVCPPETARRFDGVADAVVCVAQPDQFVAVGRWYESFDQTTDGEVVELLQRAPTGRGARPISQSRNPGGTP